MSKKIIFEAAEENTEHLSSPPKPAKKYVPEWYKSQRPFASKETNLKKIFAESPINGTYKICMPLVDAVTSGYMLEAPASIFVHNVGVDKYNPYLKWTVSYDLADTIKPEAMGNYPIPTGYNPTMFRWIFDWKITTPPGYSLLITHPSHRHDLPFYTLTAIVDTDKHPNKILLPFFIKEGYEGMIEVGTPIAQIIPIKRDAWQSETKSYNPVSKYLNKDIMKLDFVRGYKNRYWNKKEYN